MSAKTRTVSVSRSVRWLRAKTRLSNSVASVRASPVASAAASLAVFCTEKLRARFVASASWVQDSSSFFTRSWSSALSCAP